MSINSLCSNPQILNDLVVYIEENVQTNGISVINNQDGNFNLSKNGNTETVNLNNSITVNNSITTNQITTPSIFNNGGLDLQQNNLSVSLGSTGLFLVAGTNSVYFDNNGNFYLSGTNLKLNSNNNPFSTDGSENQLLASDGSGNLKWVDNNNPNTPSEYLKSILSVSSSQLSSQSGATISVFNIPVSGFTVGKNSLYKVYFSFIGNDVLTATMTLYINGNPVQSINTFVNSPLIGVPSVRGVIFQYQNQTNTQQIELRVEASNSTLSLLSTCYYTLSILQIN